MSQKMHPGLSYPRPSTARGLIGPLYYLPVLVRVGLSMQAMSYLQGSQPVKSPGPPGGLASVPSGSAGDTRAHSLGKNVEPLSELELRVTLPIRVGL